MVDSGNFLSSEFLKQYENQQPRNKGILFEVLHLRTYSRWVPEKKRRETWLETVQRVVEYNLDLYQGPASREELIKEAELMFDKVFHLEVLPSGRSLWIGGTDAAKKHPESNFNCSGLVISKLDDFCDIFHLLLCGCGVGYRVLKDDVNNLPLLNANFNVSHDDYTSMHPSVREEHTSVRHQLDEVRIVIGDSKGAWVQALRMFLHTLAASTGRNITINFNYDNIRPAGERIKTFGGIAPGHQGLKDMFTNLEKIIKDSEGVITPVVAMDIANTISMNVIVGGTRRSALIALGSPDDQEFIEAKKNLYTKIDGKWIKDESKASRNMSNNTVVYNDKPDLEYLQDVFSNIKTNGEPGFLNIAAANKRRPNANTINPCLTKDTWILTSVGPRQIKDLLDSKFKAVIDGKSYQATEFFKTGTKSIFNLRTMEGYEVKLTDNHKVHTTNGWVEAKDLKSGDRILLNRVKGMTWQGHGTKEEGWLLGSLIGDGCFSIDSNLAYLRYWGDSKEEISEKALELVSASVKHRSDLSVVKSKNGYNQIACVGVSNLAERYGVSKNKKVVISKEIETASSDFYEGFLRGIFDADGSVQGSTVKGRSIRLSQINLEFLRGIQRMLLRLGIKSILHSDRTEARFKSMPDGRGGMKEYFCQPVHELIISRDSMYTYADRVGFLEPAKTQRLAEFISTENTRNLYKDKFEARFDSLEYVSTEDVYDCTVDTIHEFDANGLRVHNCGEILMDNYGVCNLSTVVITSHIKDGKIDYESLEESVRLATRIGLRQTNVSLSLPHWDYVQKRDRLTGVSMTGFMDAVDRLGLRFDSNKIQVMLESMRHFANDEADRYAYEMRVPRPLLVTAIKPEGSLSQLPTVSSGLHRSYAPYYIRRIRVSALDSVCRALQALGIPNEPDVTKKDSNRVVFSFPIKSGAAISANDESALDQFNRYLQMQNLYTDHNSSCTLTVGDSEWDDIVKAVYDGWDNGMVACTFLSKDCGSYPQMPYEAISKDEYDRLVEMMPKDLSILYELVNKFEVEKDEESELDDDECKSGHCPVR